MPDDLHIPNAANTAGPVRSSYRARRPGMDQGTKYLLLAAAGLGGLLLAGMASWALIGGHGAAVPVIEADSRPIRVKPENAGGLQVAGAEDPVMGNQAARTQSMAPAAETPAPQALRAQNPPQARPPAVAPTAPGQPETAAANIPSPPAVPHTAQAVRPVVAPTAGPVVQLAAVESEQTAQAEWQRLAKRMPDLLGTRRALLQRAEHDGHAVWRIRTSGFADIAEATSFCARVRAKGGSCTIASF